jgi:hypothetical protein
MIGAALRVTWAAIPAAAAAPASRSHGRPTRPPPSEVCSRRGAGSAAGLIASCGSARGAGGRSSACGLPVRRFGRTFGATEGGDGAEARALGARRALRCGVAFPGPLAGRGGSARTRADGTGRTTAGRPLGARTAAVVTRGTAVGCAGSAATGSAATGSAAPTSAGAAAATGSIATVTGTGSTTAGGGAGSGSGDAAGAGSGAVEGGRAGSSRIGST